MFQKFHALREEREGGFTLIELLVVILIIAILAAIAIPVFLKQREKGWVGAMESSLKDASIAAESFATGCGDGNYLSGGGAGCAAAGTALRKVDLESEGWNETDEVVLAAPAVSADGNTYCLQVSHTRYKGPSDPMHFLSTDGKPVDGACPAI